MTPAETADFLRQFNEWRIGDEDLPQPDTFKITRAIYSAVDLIEAADEDRALCDKLSSILQRTANALKGDPKPLHRHSWHDLPEVARRIVEEADEIERLRAEIESMKSTWLSPETYEALMQERQETLHELARVQSQNEVLMAAINKENVGAFSQKNEAVQRDAGCKHPACNGVLLEKSEASSKKHRADGRGLASACPRNDCPEAETIRRLTHQNAILTDAINAAAQIMASAPAWHAMHREAIAGLQAVKKEMES